MAVVVKSEDVFAVSLGIDLQKIIQNNPALQQIITAWPELSEPAKSAILEIIENQFVKGTENE